MGAGCSKKHRRAAKVRTITVHARDGLTEEPIREGGTASATTEIEEIEEDESSSTPSPGSGNSSSSSEIEEVMDEEDPSTLPGMHYADSGGSFHGNYGFYGSSSSYSNYNNESDGFYGSNNGGYYGSGSHENSRSYSYVIPRPFAFDRPGIFFSGNIHDDGYEPELPGYHVYERGIYMFSDENSNNCHVM
uniref:Uncharacterized protein n=1 Tax=Nelumbo nucifera TaxID=4432 RepID=A0A822XJN9_NELNU|nr:TPA_asm: hypothetical protein HUJ06_020742 [Nelumbo nucifera]